MFSKEGRVDCPPSDAVKRQFRIEADSMGEVRVPADAYYGAQTGRAVGNFPISGLRFSRGFIRALGLIKRHAAATNSELGLMDQRLATVIQQAAQEVERGRRAITCARSADVSFLAFTPVHRTTA
jgi:fumarate hydratase class II